MKYWFGEPPRTATTTKIILLQKNMLRMLARRVVCYHLRSHWKGLPSCRMIMRSSRPSDRAETSWSSRISFFPDQNVRITRDTSTGRYRHGNKEYRFVFKLWTGRLFLLFSTLKWWPEVQRSQAGRQHGQHHEAADGPESSPATAQANIRDF